MTEPPVTLTLTLPAAEWSDIVGVLWSVAWADPAGTPRIGALAGRLYGEYAAAQQLPPTLGVELLVALAERLCGQGDHHG